MHIEVFGKVESLKDEPIFGRILYFKADPLNSEGRTQSVSLWAGDKRVFCRSDKEWGGVNGYVGGRANMIWDPLRQFVTKLFVQNLRVSRFNSWIRRHMSAVVFILFVCYRIAEGQRTMLHVWSTGIIVEVTVFWHTRTAGGFNFESIYLVLLLRKIWMIAYQHTLF